MKQLLLGLVVIIVFLVSCTPEETHVADEAASVEPAEEVVSPSVEEAQSEQQYPDYLDEALEELEMVG